MPVIVAELSAWWIVGWAVGFGGAVVAALLLVWIIALGRRIVSQAQDIGTAIDRAHANTSAMFEQPRTNLALDRMRRALQTLREGES